MNSLYYGVFVGAIEGVGLSGMSVMAIVETRLECGMLLCGNKIERSNQNRRVLRL